MTLAELTAQFTGLMNRRDLSANSTLVTNFINQAIMRIQRELRCPAMEKSVLVTIADPYNGLVIPSDLIELISIIPQNSTFARRLKRVRLEKALNYATFSTDCPEIFARQGGVYVLGPSPAIGDVIRVDYYAELAPLVNPTDTNVISIIAWDLIVYAALVAACEFFKDSRMQAFEQRYQQIISDIQDQADLDELESVTEVQPCWSYPDDDTDNYEIWVA
jgi:hypothetical protein